MGRGENKEGTKATSIVKEASPLGESVAESSAKRARQSKAYRDEQARLAPYEAIARVVIRRRMELDLTQKQVAERMGTSHTAISRIESGQHPSKQETLSRLAGALEMTYVHGFELSDAEHPEQLLVTV